ncbi:unnamed protein product [Arabidopsis halleri]
MKSPLISNSSILFLSSLLDLQQLHQIKIYTSARQRTFITFIKSLASDIF